MSKSNPVAIEIRPESTVDALRQARLNGILFAADWLEKQGDDMKGEDSGLLYWACCTGPATS